MTFTRMLSQTLIAGVIVGLVAGCSESGGTQCVPLDYEANPASVKYDFGAVDEAVADFMVDYPVVEGVTLAVVRRDEGQIYERGYGDFERDRISMIASVSKVLSAGVILTAVDDELLELDRPVADYLDWGDYHPGVTIRNMLSMMSGIPGISGTDTFDDPCVCDPATTLEECAQSVFRNESHSIPPGEEFRYSAGAWQLAGAVAEVVSNSSWADLIQQRLLSPCGLCNAGYRAGEPSILYPFDTDPTTLPETANPSLGGGAYSTVNDYSKVLLMHLRDGRCGQERVLSPEMVQLMREDLVPEGVKWPSWRDQAINYGMGWWKYEDEPGLLIDSGAWGARALLHPDEDWGAIMILEAGTGHGSELRERLVPAIREALGIDQS